MPIKDDERDREIQDAYERARLRYRIARRKQPPISDEEMKAWQSRKKNSKESMLLKSKSKPLYMM